ncbi:hypothetical protein ACFY1L_35545 [Streptomyces sp. NPDC001663]|uniref:hypothetical protein n=1 Tax=Streptomyces sp. NPDC001663 TaxID=3364597 RepID=UPI003691FA80
MRVPERARKSVNVLLCLVAVAGIGWSGKEIWQVLRGRQQIDEACAGLVPAGRVLALSPAGGTITHRVADEGTIELDAGLPQDCEIFSTEAGEKGGSRSGERWFFTGAVGAVGQGEGLSPEASWDDLLDPGGPYSDHTYPDQPLGGGIAGIVTDTGVTVELPCAKGVSDGRRVKALWARASFLESETPFSDNGQPTAHDRGILAETAVITANRLAGRLGCTERLPDPPDDIPALVEGPTPAAEAEGTCAWYRRTGLADRTLYADQVLESRTDPKAWDERCALVLGDTRANTLYAAHADELDSVYRPDRPGRYFAAFHTYSGENAKNIHLPNVDSHETPVAAEPGRAGRGDDEPAWWASSVCSGKPQIHTMTLSYGYEKLATAAYEKVFRAYVDDVTARRGCTDVKFPATSAFHAD